MTEKVKAQLDLLIERYPQLADMENDNSEILIILLLL